MARPLPKTNAPALANSQKMFASEGTSGAAAAGTASAKTPGSPATLERSRVRRERQPARPAVSTPARPKSHTISRSVHAVVSAITAAIVQSSASSRG